MSMIQVSPDGSHGNSMIDLLEMTQTSCQNLRNPCLQIFNHRIGAFLNLQSLGDRVSLDSWSVVSGNLLYPCAFLWCPHRGTELLLVRLSPVGSLVDQGCLYQDIGLQLLNLAFYLVNCYSWSVKVLLHLRSGREYLVNSNAMMGVY